MEKNDALNALAALGQETRLDVFRLLVKAGKQGLTAGAVADALEVLPNTLSTHLAALSRSGLVDAERAGRSIQYRANLDTMQFLVTFLLQDCCGGHPELCAPIVELAKPVGSSKGGTC